MQEVTLKVTHDDLVVLLGLLDHLINDDDCYLYEDYLLNEEQVRLMVSLIEYINQELKESHDDI